MVDFVAGLEAAEDGDGGFDGGFVDGDGLEAALERGVFTYRLAVLVRYEDGLVASGARVL